MQLAPLLMERFNRALAGAATGLRPARPGMQRRRLASGEQVFEPVMPVVETHDGTSLYTRDAAIGARARTEDAGALGERA